MASRPEANVNSFTQTVPRKNARTARSGTPKRNSAILGTALCTLTAALIALACWAGDTSGRPKILGIAAVEIWANSIPSSCKFYSKILPSPQTDTWCHEVGTQNLILDSSQKFSLSSTAKRPRNLVLDITFATDDLLQMASYLQAHKYEFEGIDHSGQLSRISLIDPGGNMVSFVQTSAFLYTNPVSTAKERIIHAGFVVKDRALMDEFYKDILGFHVYWTGGMKDGVTDWVDMQVPDGTDWIEYMLNIPDNADKQTLGVMNHIALGVPDVRAAAKELEAKGMKWPEPPQIGRDGKWQLNLYDPDKTRVELMEFTPTEKPCCSEYTGPHPKP
jgi:catechol 2,3-dioxygenase-like lactoylglutathione lyase family enzyme